MIYSNAVWVASFTFVVEFEVLYWFGRSMQPTILTIFLDFPSTTFLMSAAGLALLLIGLLAAKNDIAQARWIDKVAALTHFALPSRWQSSAQNTLLTESPF